MDSMNARFKSLGFGSKRKSSSSNTSVPASSYNNQSNAQGSTNLALQTSQSSSNTSLSMNNQPNQLGRPPSYTYPAQGRSNSPMPPGQQYAQHPPPIDTRYGGSPPIAPPGYQGAYVPAHGVPTQNMGVPYRPAEVEAGARSKAQLIVGIDFVSGGPLAEDIPFSLL